MNLNMILVDDYEFSICILYDYLEKYCDLGITISGTAKNGLEAIDLIIKNEPDIILLDLFMPKLDGFGVLKKIKELQLKRTPKIIILTACDDTNISSEALALGVDYYLVKPFDLNLLASKIKQLWDSILLNEVNSNI